ncbi:MAG: hypothetical protein ACJAS2_000748 [Pseudohongiellaceae bacterium]|jgi:hypothetical protein
MKFQNVCLALFLLLGVSGVFAQETAPYQVTRTPYGQPDFQGNWYTEFATLLERPEGVDLVVPEEQANAMGAAIFNSLPDNHDPDFDWSGVKNLALVKGEYRTSLLVDPPDGKLPYLESAMEAVAYNMSRYQTEFDHPEQRPPAERCMTAGFSGPPFQSIPLLFPYQIIQNEEHLILSAGGPGFRMIHLQAGSHQAELNQTYEGFSTGYWDGDTLVVRTSNFREDHPNRNTIGRPLLISNDTVITERFTRVSEQELHYYFTVLDDSLYTQRFSGELSLYAHDWPAYEYGCHEGNYSLPGILRGGQLQAAADD